MNLDLKEVSDQMDGTRAEFSAALGRHKEYIDLHHRILDESLKNQVSIQYEFEHLKAVSAALLKEAESLRDQYHSYAFSVEMRSNIKPNSTEARKYADCNKDYVEAVKLYNKGFKLSAEINGVVEVLVTRKFILSNLTSAVVNDVNKHIL